MPLYAIPDDPEPTEEELAPYLQDGPGRLQGASEGDLRLLARIKWKEARRAVGDSAFLIPFATEVNDYKSYTKTPIWGSIKSRVLRAANGKCACCPRTATQVHHRDYRPS